MIRRRISLSFSLVCLAMFALPAIVSAQGNPSLGGGGGANTGGAGVDTIGTTINAGVAIDAQGVLKRQMVNDPGGRRLRQQFAAARAAMDQMDVGKSSQMRMVSLNRLEAAVTKQVAQGLPATNEMLHLAGLTRVEYVFYYPESREIVIAGPAEGWAATLTGQMVGIETARPVLLLEDLIVALRAYPPGGRGVGLVGCSIDPTQEGLAKMQNFLVQMGGRATPNQTQFIVKGLKDSLGAQTITVQGISPKTNMARVLVEADYRMKLIGIGLEQPPVKFASYVSKATPTSVSRNAMQRWFFVPHYDCVRVAEDGASMKLEGEGVKLIGEHELVRGDGSRVDSGKADRASQIFVNGFTRAYPDLAARSPVYAHMRNCIDMLIATAFIQQKDLYGKAGWSLETFGSEQSYPVETHNAPKQVESAVNAIWRGRRLMTPIGGGVEIRPTRALDSANVQADTEGQVAAAQAAAAKNLAGDRWWWDAE